MNEQLEEIKEKNISLEVQVQEIPQLKLKVSWSDILFNIYLYHITL